ncbi:MAG: hypothetical protein Q9191_005646 [Dirinaria sp. TL-2023a]
MAQGNHSSGFFKLSKEIRSAIYEQVFHHTNFESYPENYFSLTMVNRQMYAETSCMAEKAYENFIIQNHRFSLKHCRSQRGRFLPSAYLIPKPTNGPFMWSSNTVNLQAFAQLRDVTLVFEESDEPWDHDDATWRRLWEGLISEQNCREDMVLNVLSKRANFVETREQLTAKMLISCSVLDERNLALQHIETSPWPERTVQFRSFRPDVAHEYVGTPAQKEYQTIVSEPDSDPIVSLLHYLRRA